MCLAGWRHSRWIWGCQGPISRERPPPFLPSGTRWCVGLQSLADCPVPSLTASCLAVCNAGVGLMGPLETCSDQAMKTLFDVNLFGAVRTIQAFLPAMKSRRAGRIIVSSSIGGLQGGTPQHTVAQGAVGKSSGAQGAALPQGCPSMLCTVPASLQWRGCARVWPSSCAPSTSSECR